MTETAYKYIIMCGGNYEKWPTPKHLSLIEGEPVVARTIRLLRECGVSDIAISSNSDKFDGFGVPVLHHDNAYYLPKDSDAKSPWLDGDATRTPDMATGPSSCPTIMVSVTMVTCSRRAAATDAPKNLRY